MEQNQQTMQWKSIESCIKWMALPRLRVLRNCTQPNTKFAGKASLRGEQLGARCFAWRQHAHFMLMPSQRRPQALPPPE